MNNELTINFDICSMELLKEYKKEYPFEVIRNYDSKI